MDPTQLPLRDIHLPDPIGWWPLGIGWWLLAIVLTGLSVVIVMYWLSWRRQRPLRLALAHLDQARAWLLEGRLNDAMQLVSQTLRRTAVTLAGEPVAGLTGQAWLVWLDSRWQRDGFSRGAGQLVASAPYRSPDSLSPEQARDLLELARAWTSVQRVGGRQP
jgi:hypothetical protein